MPLSYKTLGAIAMVQHWILSMGCAHSFGCPMDTVRTA